jgi:hypothetical protein
MPDDSDLLPYLELASDEQLLTELQRRHTSAVFAGDKDDKDATQFALRWLGNKHTCLGLAASLVRTLNSLIDSIPSTDQECDP